MGNEINNTVVDWEDQASAEIYKDTKDMTNAEMIEYFQAEAERLLLKVVAS